MAPLSPLTPRRGYVVTLSQVEGTRPKMVVSCHLCHFLSDVPVTDLEAASSTSLGEVLRAALQEWSRHMCESTSSNAATA